MIDLHIHTNYSDGKCSLTEILKMAEVNQLEYISITDHDTTDAYFELETLNIENYYSGKIMNGIEIHFNYNRKNNFHETSSQRKVHVIKGGLSWKLT